MLIVSDCENRLRSVAHTTHGAFDIFRVEGTEALVEDKEFRLLQESPGQKDSGLLPL